MKRLMMWLCVLAMVWASSAMAGGEVKVRQEAPAMLPLMLNDGTRLDLEQARGKIVVLYFYEQQCPSCRKKVPERNAWLEKFKDKPVKFVAIGAGDTAVEVQEYVRTAQLRLPVTPDPLSVLEKTWGFTISLKNIYQTRIIDSVGELVAYSVDGPHFDRALETATWRYNREGYDPALVPVLDKFEWGDPAGGAKLLKQARRTSKRSIAESAEKLFGVLKAECQSDMTQAESSLESDPVKAYDLLTRIGMIVDGDPLAKQADEKLKTLKNNKAVKDELGARKMLDQLSIAVIKARMGQEREVANYASSIAQKYPDTPTGKRVKRILEAWR